MIRKLSFLLLLSLLCLLVKAQQPYPIKRLLAEPYMKGASFSIMIKEIDSGKTLFAIDTLRQLSPASVMKTVTTATALEMLGSDYRYPTRLAYDGSIKEGKLEGNLYIQGSGDPSLGSSHLKTPARAFLQTWVNAIRQAGIQTITGTVVADESCFDTEGTSLKWLGEDLGSYYGAGSYGLAVFDNLYELALQSGAPGTRPVLLDTDPHIDGLHFHNYLTAKSVSSDSSFIVGAPFSSDRYLYGIIPAHRERYILKGDLPDPAQQLAEELTHALQKAGISVAARPTTYRRLRENEEWHPGKQTELITTYSPPLRELVRITNHASHNLYADALLKTIGLSYAPPTDEILSSFQRGVRQLQDYWKEKGFDLSTIWMYDGSGLALTNKLSTSFMIELLRYMYNHSAEGDAFKASLPRAGMDGSVRNFLKGSSWQGEARLKSGSMSRVKGYAGYLSRGGKTYAIALFVNNYACEGRVMNAAIERMLLGLLP